ncbi:MAG: hypothetical protein WA668_07375 [Candidatus Cybelea sp.]
MRLVIAIVAGLAIAGCDFAGAPGAPNSATSPGAAAAQRLKTPAVIAIDHDSERLVYWPMGKGGSSTPKFLSERLHIKATGMVANGDVVTIASYDPPELLSYNVDTQAKSAIADPYGHPLDVAIGKDGTLYALGASDVAVFPTHSSPYDLSCRYILGSTAIAVDDEGDVFVNGWGPRNPPKVVEYAAGSSRCTKLALKRPEQDQGVGVGVDPKTDDLIIEDGAGCAGGDEGRITIYQRPYGPRILARHRLHASCPAGFRLDATSSHLLVLDGYSGLRTHGGVHACGLLWVDQRLYPSARGHSMYTAGCARAVTTIPNTLPN